MRGWIETRHGAERGSGEEMERVRVKVGPWQRSELEQRGRILGEIWQWLIRFST
jgi:hypothetical protein